MIAWLLLLTASDWLALQNGRLLKVERYERQDAQVLIWRDGQSYSLPARRIDWPGTNALARQSEPLTPAQAEPREAPPRERLRAFLTPPNNVAERPDLMIDKLDVKDAPLVDVLRLIADRAGFNLAVDPAVEDVPITISFRNIRWDLALDIILQSNALVCEPMSQSLRILSLPPP